MQLFDRSAQITNIRETTQMRISSCCVKHMRLFFFPSAVDRRYAIKQFASLMRSMFMKPTCKHTWFRNTHTLHWFKCFFIGFCYNIIAFVIEVSKASNVLAFALHRGNFKCNCQGNHYRLFLTFLFSDENESHVIVKPYQQMDFGFNYVVSWDSIC